MSSEKEKKYDQACFERTASFIPICCTVDNLVGKETNHFLKKVDGFLATKWESSYMLVMRWTRTRLSFAILRAAVLCLRGSRTKWRCLGAEDGTPI